MNEVDEFTEERLALLRKVWNSSQFQWPALDAVRSQQEEFQLGLKPDSCAVTNWGTCLSSRGFADRRSMTSAKIQQACLIMAPRAF